MNVCPHCKRPGVSSWDARWSGRAHPATCQLCGGLSHVLASMTGGVLIPTWLILVVTVPAASISGSWLLGGFGCLLALAFYVRGWQQMELFPIPKRNVTVARRANWVMATIYILLELLS